MSFIFNWVNDILIYLGLWARPKNVLLVGSDNSGKKTFLRLLKQCDLIADPMCNLLAIEEVTVGEVHLRVITLSLDRGPVRLGRLRDYFCGTDGVVFMVDAADRESLKEAKEGLENVFADEYLKKCPILVLGNKIDRPGALSESELKIALQISNCDQMDDTNEQQQIQNNLFMCSLLKRIGYGEGLQWLIEQMKF